MKVRSLFTALFCAMTLAAGVALAVESPYVTYQVVYDNQPVNNRVPTLADPASKDRIAFQVINNSSEAVYFEGSGVKQYIPLVSQNTVVVPYDPNARYRLVNSRGEEVLSWQLMSMQGQSSGVMNASAEQHAQWSSELQSIIRRNQNVVVQEYHQNDPQRNNPAPAWQPEPRQRQVIRGFW